LSTFGEQVSIPVMVITGMQSAGKTTLIEAIVGFPLGYTDRALDWNRLTLLLLFRAE
jgi:recombinational DNA repair ATPase RecF